MSWLARSIANTLTLDDEDEDPKAQSANDLQNYDDPSSPQSPSRGVKEDLSELTKTLTRQFWGVASFLAPPPPQSSETYKPIAGSEDNTGSDHDESSDPAVIDGIRSDFAEMGGRFRRGISKLSDNINVSEITKMASSFLQLGNEGGEGAAGVTEEVVAFVRDIAMHPETWLDFPLPENRDNDSDFDMSDAQQEHALAVEHLAPRLAALRIELCPGYMSEGCFWKIYFVLLHPRFSKEDAELLSTPEIVKARALLARELQNRANSKSEDLPASDSSEPKDSTSSQNEESLSVPSSAISESLRLKTSVHEWRPSSLSTDLETEKCPVTPTKNPVIDKLVIAESHIYNNKDQNRHSAISNEVKEKDEEDIDDWLKEERSETGAASGTTIHIENEDDVSFSDLEEDDEIQPTNVKKTNYGSDKDSRGWVQLSSESEKVNACNSDSKESNDWSDVDDIDVA